jgi:hypothetical protein
MRLRIDIVIGPLAILFDPFGEDEDDSDDEPVVQGMGAAESLVDTNDPHRGPEMQAGHRDPWYDDGGRWTRDRRIGFWD